MLEFVDKAANKLGIKSIEDWYQVSTRQIIEIGGGSLLSCYEGSISRMISKVYSEYNWKMWKFAKSPPNLWDDEKVVKDFLEYTSKQLYIKNLDDWYSIPKRSLEELGGGPLLSKCNNFE